MRKVLRESNSFSISKAESLSSHITYTVNEYSGINIEEIQKNLGHRYTSTTLNSYINPERRNLKLFEEKNTKKNDGIETLKRRINKDNFESKILGLEESEGDDSLDFNDEGDDYIDDDFELNNKIFYLTGHFYDDFDVIEFKNKQKLLKKNITSEDSEITHRKEEKTDNYLTLNNNLNKINKNVDYIKFNKNLTLQKTYNKRKSTLEILGIKDFSKSVNVIESEFEIITSNKIKNKKDLYFLSEEENMVLQKTMELNKKGIYYNLEGIKNNLNIYIKCTSDIIKNTLITIIGGTVLFYKNLKLVKSNNRDIKKHMTILYFKTGKALYDRYIQIDKNSIINFLFPFIKKNNQI